MAKVVKIRYFTKERKSKINPKNLEVYKKYLRSNIIKNTDVKDTTYHVYENYFNQFLVYLSEQWDNIYVYSSEFMENAVDIMEGFIAFCIDTLKNNKKVINTKISAVSSFYMWSMKRKLIEYHPFDKRLDRMQKPNDEQIIGVYYLEQEQIDKITDGLIDNIDGQYDYMDLVLWSIMLDSANRIGAISKLKLSNLDMDNNCFTDVREKEGKIVEVSFEEHTKDIIQNWLAIRKESMDNCEIDALFITKYNGEWRQASTGTLQRRIKKMGQIIGLEDFRSHCIRKTRSNRLLSEGVDPYLVSKMLNHNDVSTTLNFYKKPQSVTEIRDEIRKQLDELKNKKKNKNN